MGITQKDIDCLEAYNAQIDACVSKQTAWYRTMQNASPAAQSLVEQSRTSKVAIEGLTASTNASSLAMIGMRVATMALNAAISMGLAIAIQGLISGLDYLIHYQEKQAEAAKEQAEKSQEAADKADEEVESLSDLISKYKELAESDKRDVKTVTETRDIQSEITRLVGDQATNLDLVNGRLDDQLEKLKRIQKQNLYYEIPKYRTAASDKMDTSFDSTEGYGVFEIDALNENIPIDIARRISDDLNSLWIKNIGHSLTSEKSKNLYDRSADWIDAIEGGNGWDLRNGYEKQNVSGVRLDFGDFGEIPFDEISAQIKDWLEYLHQENLDGTEFYNKLSRYKTQVDNYVNDNRKSLSKLANAMLGSSDYDNKSISSVNDFNKLYNRIIKDLENDTTIKEALKRGLIDDNWISEQAKNYLSGLENFSDIYDKWYKKYESEVGKGIIAVKKKVKESTSSDVALSSEDSEKKIQDFNRWINGLSDEDKELVYQISIDKESQDYAEWTLAEWQKKLDEARKSASPPAKSFSEITSGVQKLEKGFDQIAKIYKDVKDKEVFDWSAILNNDDFKDTFGNMDGYKKEYESFIETISNSPTDIKACQDAFNNLATAYVYSSGALDDVTEATKQATINMLEDMGITNAAEIVNYKLATSKENLEKVTAQYKDMTAEEIAKLYAEAAAGSVTQKALHDLLVEKINIALTKIDSSSDVSNLISLANAANATRSSLHNLATAKSELAKAESYEEKAKNTDGKQKKKYLSKAKTARNKADKILNKNIKYKDVAVEAPVAQVKYIDTKSSGSGSGSGSSSGSSGSTNNKKRTPLEKFKDWFGKLFDWIEIKLQRQTDRINKYISRAEKAQERKSYKTAISNYRKGIDATAVQIGYEQTANTKYNSQANKILNKAVSQGLISSKQSKTIAKNVKNGTMNISEYGDKVREVISNYQTWYNKAKDAKDAIEELHENIRTYISDLKAVRDAQRETKLGNITYRSDIATSSNADTTAASNNQLSYTNTQLDNQTGAYSTEISNTLSDRNNLAKKATKAISKAKKGKNKQYKKALKDAKKAIKKRKPVPSGTLSVIRKNNRKLYEKIYAYNLSLDNIETAREEYATVAATNIAEQYANREAQYENTRQQISDRTSLAESQMNNVTGTARNVYLDTIASNYASATQTSQNAVNSFQKSVNNQSAAINKNFKGSNFSKVSKSTRKAINNTIAKIRGITKAKKKVIDASLMDKLATYIKKGYVKQSFYTACLRYNNAIDSLIEANAQLEIDKAAEEANKLEDASARVANIQTDYSNKRNGITYDSNGNLRYGSTAQINKLQSEHSVRTSAGKILKSKDYQDLIKASQEEQALFNAEAVALEAQINANLAANPAYAKSQNYIDDMAALEEAKQGAENAEQAQNEWNASIANLPTDNLDRATAYLDSILGYLQSIVSLKQALHETLSFDDYNNQIEDNKSKIEEYYNALFGDRYAGEFSGKSLEEMVALAQNKNFSAYRFRDIAGDEGSLFWNYANAYRSSDGYFGGKSAEEWLQEVYNKYADINGLVEENIKLHSELVDNVYLAKYTKAIELLDKTEDLLSGINSIIVDEMKVDENGFITDYGMLALATTVEELENATQQAAQYSEEINDLNRRLADGTITQVEYDDRINDVRKSYLDAAKNAEDYASAIVDVYKSQAQAEVDALNEVIEARQEALNKKKAYYDYDSSLKEKTRDIRELEAELAALEGIETAAGKAKAAQLRADLVEKQDDLNDTLREHAIELSDNALSEMSESIQKAFDDYWKKLWNNMDDVKKLLAAAIDDSGSVNKSELINSILKGFGLSGTYESTGINTHYASGTKYVPHNLTAKTNEKGREAIVTKNGIILPLLQGEGVIPADLTERLFALASSDLPLGKIAANGNGTNIDVHYDNLINIEGSADAATVEDLKRFSKDVVQQSYEYTSSKLYKGYVGSGGKRKI